MIIVIVVDKKPPTEQTLDTRRLATFCPHKVKPALSVIIPCQRKSFSFVLGKLHLSSSIININKPNITKHFVGNNHSKQIPNGNVDLKGKREL